MLISLRNRSNIFILLIFLLSIILLPSTLSESFSAQASCFIPNEPPRCGTENYAKCVCGLGGGSECSDTTTFNIPSNCKATSATIFFTGHMYRWKGLDDEGWIRLNGQEIHRSDWDFCGDRYQLAGSKSINPNLLHTGLNRLDLWAKNTAWDGGGVATLNVNMNCCDVRQGQSCGSCGGRIQCNGACSISTPSNFGNSCSKGIGECRRTGTIQCSGACSASAGSPSSEICDNKDNNCNNNIDEICDNDNDNYCEAGITRIGTPSTCTAGGNDQNDNDPYINPGFPEICDNKDNDQDSLTDEGCDSDKDSYSEKPATCLGNFKDGNNIVRSCSQFGPPNNGDCNDANANINPAISEICNNIDDDCDETIDEGCDDDKDGFVDPIMTCIGIFRDGKGIVKPCP